MTAPEPAPTVEHIDAVARAIHAASWSWINPHNAAHSAGDLLTWTDPAVHAAMLDALVRAGVLTEEAEDIIGFHDETCPDPCPFGKRRRLVTPWAVAS